MTRLMSSLARLLVSARTDRDIMLRRSAGRHEGDDDDDTAAAAAAAAVGPRDDDRTMAAAATTTAATVCRLLPAGYGEDDGRRRGLRGRPATRSHGRRLWRRRRLDRNDAKTGSPRRGSGAG